MALFPSLLHAAPHQRTALTAWGIPLLGLVLGAMLAIATPLTARADAYADALAGLAAVREGDAAHGLELLTRAIESGDLRESNLVIAYYNRANARYHLGELEQALADLTEALTINPRFVEAFIKRGAVRKELGDYETAVADFSRALELNPDNARALYLRGLTYALAGDGERSMKDIAAAHRVDQRFLITPLLHAVSAVGTEYAIAFMDRALESGELGPANAALTHYHRGLAWRVSGGFEKAMADFDQAIALNPDLAEAYARRADIHMERQAPRAAIKDYTKALAIDPDMAEALYRRGFAWAQLEENRKALQDFTAAHELDPTLEPPDMLELVGPESFERLKARLRESGNASNMTAFPAPHRNASLPVERVEPVERVGPAPSETSHRNGSAGAADVE